jgi:hypothetical protein
MICGTARRFAGSARVRVNRFVCYRVPAGTPFNAERGLYAIKPAGLRRSSIMGPKSTQETWLRVPESLCCCHPRPRSTCRSRDW